MKTFGALQVRPQGDREVVITRAFAAPRELVFDCMTVPALMKRWRMAPPRWTVLKVESDPRVGGHWRFEMRSDDGEVMGFGGTYLEVNRPERFVGTEKFDQPWYPGECVGTNAFTERAGATTLTMTLRYESTEARNAVYEHPYAAPGMEQGYATLDAALAELTAG